jgi:hypothetical protein
MTVAQVQIVPVMKFDPNQVFATSHLPERN